MSCYKDVKVEGDDSATVASTVLFFSSALVQLVLDVSLCLLLLRHWRSHHAGLRLWRGAHLAVP